MNSRKKAYAVEEAEDLSRKEEAIEYDEYNS